MYNSALHFFQFRLLIFINASSCNVIYFKALYSKSFRSLFLSFCHILFLGSVVVHIYCPRTDTRLFFGIENGHMSTYRYKVAKTKI